MYVCFVQENILARILLLPVVFLFSDFVSNVIPCVAAHIQRSLPRACKSRFVSRAALSVATREKIKQRVMDLQKSSSH